MAYDVYVKKSARLNEWSIKPIKTISSYPAELTKEESEDLFNKAKENSDFVRSICETTYSDKKWQGKIQVNLKRYRRLELRRQAGEQVGGTKLYEKIEKAKKLVGEKEIQRVVDDYFRDYENWEQGNGKKPKKYHTFEGFDYQAICNDMWHDALIQLLTPGQKPTRDEIEIKGKNIKLDEQGKVLYPAEMAGAPPEDWQQFWDQLKVQSEEYQDVAWVYHTKEDILKPLNMVLAPLAAVISLFGKKGYLAGTILGTPLTLFSAGVDLYEEFQSKEWHDMSRQLKYYTEELDISRSTLKSRGEKVVGKVAQKRKRGKGQKKLKVRRGQLRKRMREIEMLTPTLVNIGVKRHINEVKEGIDEDDVISPGESLLDYLPENIVATIKTLLKNLYAQPNPLIIAYDFLDEYYKNNPKDLLYPEGEEDPRRSIVPDEVVGVLNEYIDQTYWRLVPNDTALKHWSVIFNMSEGSVRTKLPQEPAITFTEVSKDDPWFQETKSILSVTEQAFGDLTRAWMEGFTDLDHANLFKAEDEMREQKEEVEEGIELPEELREPVSSPPLPETTSTPPLTEIVQYEQTTDSLAATAMAADFQPAQELQVQTSAISWGGDGYVMQPYPAGGATGGNVNLDQYRGTYVRPAVYTHADEQYFYPRQQVTHAVQPGVYLQPQASPQPAPQIVHRFERGSVQIHTQKIDAKTLGNAFVSFLQEQSRK